MFYLDAFKTISQTLISQSSKKLRWPGIEPGSNAWKASMLTITPPTLVPRPIPKLIDFKLKPDRREFIVKIESDEK